MRYVIIIAIMWCVIPLSVMAQEEDSLRVNVKGFVDTYHAVRIESPNDWMSSRSRVRGEVTIEKGMRGRSFLLIWSIMPY